MEEGKLRRLVYTVALIIGGGAILFLFFKHLFLLLLPFLIAWAVAFAIRPLAARLGSKTKISVRALRVILSLALIIAAIGVIFFIAWALCAELWRLLSGLGEGEVLRDIIDKIASGGIFGGFLESFGDRLADVFYNFLISVATALGEIVTSSIAAVPGILLFVLVTVIASVYFALDLEAVNSAVLKLSPSWLSKWLTEFKRGFFAVGLRYVRSYLILMLMTFAIMLTGLMILGRPYALLLAFVIAILDVLPVIGVGTVLIPWGIYEIAFADERVGFGLLILFGTYELIRQFTEPRIVGKHLGVHPLVTLLLIYVGYSLFGFMGILIVPLATVLINITISKNNSAEIGKGVSAEHDRA